MDVDGRSRGGDGGARPLRQCHGKSVRVCVCACVPDCRCLLSCALGRLCCENAAPLDAEVLLGSLVGGGVHLHLSTRTKLCLGTSVGARKYIGIYIRNGAIGYVVVDVDPELEFREAGLVG